VGPSLRAGAAATLELPFARGLSVELAVTDLLQTAAPDPLPADSAPVTELPQDPRTFRFGLRYAFE
jgi:hypothetical protein